MVNFDTAAIEWVSGLLLNKPTYFPTRFSGCNASWSSRNGFTAKYLGLYPRGAAACTAAERLIIVIRQSLEVEVLCILGC